MTTRISLSRELKSHVKEFAVFVDIRRFKAIVLLLIARLSRLKLKFPSYFNTVLLNETIKLSVKMTTSTFECTNRKQSTLDDQFLSPAGQLGFMDVNKQNFRKKFPPFSQRFLAHNCDVHSSKAAEV